MEEKLQSFTYGQKVDCLNLIKTLETNGWTVSDFKEFMKSHKPVVEKKLKRGSKEEREAQSYFRKLYKWLKKGAKCPTCEMPLQVFDVNTNPRNQVGEDLMTQLICSNPDCDYEEFSKESVDQLFRSYKIT